MSAFITLYDGTRCNPVTLEYPLPAREVYTRALAMLNRYTGHTLRPLSVAEHSANLCQAMERIAPHLCRAACIHDFNEAMMNDVPHPFKRMGLVDDYLVAEVNVQKAIFQQFNEPWENMEELIQYDRRICKDEMATLCPMSDYKFEFDGLDLHVGREEIHWEAAWRRLEYYCDKYKVIANAA